jgi:hypothetical protein
MKNAHNFVDNGIYNLKYPMELREKVISALEAWKKFVNTDDAVTEQFPYAQGVGYEHQKGGGVTNDHKKDFHYTEDGADFLFEAASKSGNELRQVSEELIKQASYLIAYLGPTVWQFANEMEKELGIENFANEVMASRGTWFLRFLHYPGDRQVGECMAVPHIDKSAFTFHLYESDPGLQALTYGEKKWVNTPVSETETVIFPGFQLQRKTEGKVTALCHRVVATEKTYSTGRYSMVVFFSLKNTPKYDKTQGRLQDFTPGFNYELSPGEVQKMFT